MLARQYLGRQYKRYSEIYDHYFQRNFMTDISIFKNIHKNERCFVIGNGPSINKMNLNLLKDEVTFCSNSFFLKFPELDFTPNYLTVEDSLVIDDNIENFNQLKKINKFYPFDQRNKLVKDDFSFFVEFRRVFQNNIYKNHFRFNNEDEIFFWGGTVIYFSLQLAYYMGFKEIYLIGIDLTYKIPKDAKIEKDIITSNSDDPNHFNPLYFGKGKKWHLPETERMQKSFDFAFKHLHKKNVKLYNSTVGGKLKNIPRRNFNSLFNEI